MSTGKIVQVMGPVVDVAFESGDLPEIYTALEILQKDDRVICEVQQHLGESTVRTVSMGSTDGLSRGMDVKDLGEPITTPVGKAVLGRIINVTGDPVDEAGPITADARWSIHRDAPPFAGPGVNIDNEGSTDLRRQTAGGRTLWRSEG